MKAQIYSRPQFCELTPSKELVAISIWTPSQFAVDYNKYQPNLDGWKDVLKITFNDVTYQGDKAWILFNADIAKQIVEFIYKNHNSDFVIHCDAGISRSVAIGCYLRDMWGYELELHSIHTDEFRNSLVYSILMQYK